MSKDPPDARARQRSGSPQTRVCEAEAKLTQGQHRGCVAAFGSGETSAGKWHPEVCVLKSY